MYSFFSIVKSCTVAKKRLKNTKLGVDKKKIFIRLGGGRCAKSLRIPDINV